MNCEIEIMIINASSNVFLSSPFQIKVWEIQKYNNDNVNTTVVVLIINFTATTVT